MKIRVISPYRQAPNNVDELDELRNPIAFFFRAMDPTGKQLASVTVRGVDGGETTYERVTL